MSAIIGGHFDVEARVFWLLLWLFVIVPPAEPIIVTLTGGAGPVDVPYVAAADERLTITARSLAEEPIDVTLEILHDEQQMAYDDDHGTARDELAALDSAIVDFVPPAAGTYTLRIHSFNGAQSGDVEVRVQALPLIPNCDTPLHHATLATNGTAACWLALDAGATLTLAARDVSGTLDPVLRLLDADGAVLAHNDDHAGDDLTLNVLDAKIVDYPIPTDGRFLVEVRDFGSAAGTVEVEIDRAGS
jgi:hypothetical protein